MCVSACMRRKEGEEGIFVRSVQKGQKVLIEHKSTQRIYGLL